MNLGSGQEISIKEVSLLIAELVGYTGTITWDTSKPDGQPRRLFDTSKAQAEFQFTAQTSFRDGLAATVQWYQEHVATSAIAMPA